MRCVDCKFHKAFPTTNIHWCEATKKHKRISDEDAYVDAPCKVADRKTENSSEIPNNCEDLQDWKDRMWAEAIVTEPTRSKMEQVKDEPQTEDACKGCVNKTDCPWR